MREFSAEEKQWVIDHYLKVKQKDIAKYLNCSPILIRRLVKELGIWRKPENVKAKMERIPDSMHSEGDRYCIECCHYVKGGTCGKNGKIIGALHQKKCFT